MKHGADWLAWSLRFIFGLFVGAFVGTWLISRRFGFPLVGYDLFFIFILGAALVGGAVASHYGDELWLHLVYRVFPPNAPEQSNLSNVCSLVIGNCGVLLMLFAVCRNFDLI
jgi:hypothetical protein